MRQYQKVFGLSGGGGYVTNKFFIFFLKKQTDTQIEVRVDVKHACWLNPVLVTEEKSLAFTNEAF